MFNDLPQVMDATHADKVATEIEPIIKAWQQEIIEFTKLRTEAMSKVPGLGPLLKEGQPV